MIEGSAKKRRTGGCGKRDEQHGDDCKWSSVRGAQLAAGALSATIIEGDGCKMNTSCSPGITLLNDRRQGSKVEEETSMLEYVHLVCSHHGTSVLEHFLPVRATWYVFVQQAWWCGNVCSSYV